MGASEGLADGASEGLADGASEGVADGVTVEAGHAAPFPRSQHFSVPHGATRSLLDLTLQVDFWTSQRSLGIVPSILLL